MAWNVFKFCTILRVAGSLMVFVVMGVIAVSYYALVFATYLPNLFKGASDSALSAFILILFHLLDTLVHRDIDSLNCRYEDIESLFVDIQNWPLQTDNNNLHESLFMLLWCYFSVVLTDPGGVPPAWTPTTDENDLEAETVPLSLTPAQSGALLNSSSIMYSKLQNQKIRFCRKCCQFKPPRCHHCSVCGRCILKMDHHCVWVVNCVGARNYKAFLLFLLYTFLETTLAASVLLPYFIAFFSDVEEDAGSPGNLAMVFLGFVLNLAFAPSVLGFMIMHASLVAGNTTTIESLQAYEKKKCTKWKYDLGRSKNFEQVFGTNKLYWLIPLYAEEDLRRMPELQGLEYPCKPDISGDNF